MHGVVGTTEGNRHPSAGLQGDGKEGRHSFVGKISLKRTQEDSWLAHLHHFLRSTKQAILTAHTLKKYKKKKKITANVMLHFNCS